MKIVNEFREFAMRGNVVDLAVGVIMGAAFGPIVSTLVDNIIMPPIGMLLADIDFSKLQLTLRDAAEGREAVAIRYGLFLNALIKFALTAFAIFLLVKTINTLRRPAPASAPAAPPPSEVYLREIRDALVKR